MTSEPPRERRRLIDVLGVPDDETARRLLAAWELGRASTGHGTAPARQRDAQDPAA